MATLNLDHKLTPQEVISMWRDRAFISLFIVSTGVMTFLIGLGFFFQKTYLDVSWEQYQYRLQVIVLIFWSVVVYTLFPYYRAVGILRREKKERTKKHDRNRIKSTVDETYIADFQAWYQIVLTHLPNIANTEESKREINEAILRYFYPQKSNRYIKKCFNKLKKEHKLILHDDKWIYSKP